MKTKLVKFLKLYSKNLNPPSKINNQRLLSEIEKLLKNNPVKIHLGCGTIYKEGWINIDSKSNEFPGIDSNKVDIIYDLTNPLPIPDESVDFIFHDNFFEHLSYDNGLNLLKDHFRILKKGGVVRINQPDLEKVVNFYIRDNFRSLIINGKPYNEHYAGYACLRNRAESINYCFRQFGQHKYLYDFEAMKLRLIDAGFSENNIKRCNATISEFSELLNLERSSDQLSLVIEAIR